MERFLYFYSCFSRTTVWLLQRHLSFLPNACSSLFARDVALKILATFKKLIFGASWMRQALDMWALPSFPFLSISSVGENLAS